MDYQNLYNTNADFKRHVDRYCKQYRLAVEEALEHKLVQSVGDMYAEDGKNIYGKVGDKECRYMTLISE